MWAEVRGYEGVYRVSDTGKVFSSRAGRCLSPFLVKGYPTVGLKVGGLRQAFRVHCLVAEAFHGSRPNPQMHCAHLDGNPLNNRAENLAWVTGAENEAHKKLHHTSRQGQRSHFAKLTDEQAALVRVAAGRRLTRAELARLVGISEAALYELLSGKTYALTSPVPPSAGCAQTPLSPPTPVRTKP